MIDILGPRPTRRSFVGGVLAIGLLPRAGIAAHTTQLMAGTYANEGGAGLVSLTAKDGAWMPATRIFSPDRHHRGPSPSWTRTTSQVKAGMDIGIACT